MLRSVRRLPFFKILAIAQVAMLARRHLAALAPEERQRLTELVRRGHHLPPDERHELLGLVRKLEPRAFAVSAADYVSPFPLPKRILGGRRRRG
jgi:transposase